VARKLGRALSPSGCCGDPVHRRLSSLLAGSPVSLSGTGAGVGTVRCCYGGVGARCRVVLVLVWFVVAACWVLVLVWCRSSSPANTRNPPCEQLLAGLVAGAESSVHGVGDGCSAGRRSPRS
jgi:hypothetical protein